MFEREKLNKKISERFMQHRLSDFSNQLFTNGNRARPSDDVATHQKILKRSNQHPQNKSISKRKLPTLSVSTIKDVHSNALATQ